MSPLREAQMSDDAITVTCSKCGYETTYNRSDGAPQDLSLYGKCPEITRRIDEDKDVDEIGGNPMHCVAFRTAANAAVEDAAAKDREPPTGR